jgi:hypothetical protein
VARVQEAVKLAEKWQRRYDEIQGEKNALIKQLKQKFDCDGLKAAARLIERLEREEKEIAADLEKMMDGFEANWGFRYEP